MENGPYFMCKIKTVFYKSILNRKKIVSQKHFDIVLNGNLLLSDMNFIIGTPLSQIEYNCEMPIVFMKSMT